MSQARSFTIELTQVGTGKKATVKVNQGGFIPEYTFKWESNGTSTFTLSHQTSKSIRSSVIDIVSNKTTLNSADPDVIVGYSIENNNSSMVKIIDVPEKPGIIFELSQNPTYSSRSATITLTQRESGKTIKLIITQNAKADDGVFKADPTELSFEAASATKSSKITSTSKGQTVGWTVTNKSSMPSWLTISGEGTGTLSANVKDNA